jgi:hypothetical protein
VRPSALAGIAAFGLAVWVVVAFAKMGLFARGWDEAPVIRKRACEINDRKGACAPILPSALPLPRPGLPPIVRAITRGSR